MFLRNLPSPSYSRIVVVVSGSEKIIIAAIPLIINDTEREWPNAGGHIYLGHQPGFKGGRIGSKGL